MSIQTRAKKVLNLDQYSQINRPDKIGEVSVSCPHERQYILRMLVKEPFKEYKIPSELA